MNSLATLPIHRFGCGRSCSPFTICLPHACIRFRKFLHQIHVTVGAAGKSSTVLGSAFGAEHGGMIYRMRFSLSVPDKQCSRKVEVRRQICRLRMGDNVTNQDLANIGRLFGNSFFCAAKARRVSFHPFSLFWCIGHRTASGFLNGTKGAIN